MNFSQLKYFAEVVRTKSLNQAAKNCYITYPAILKAMNSLEEELKTHLFNRSRSGVSLTANGEKFYNDVLQILELQKNWEKFSSSDSVTINILSSTTPCFTILNKVLPKMAQKYPNINLTYTPMLSKEIPDSLLDPKKPFRIALTCRFPGHPDIRTFAQEHHMECEYLYTAPQCAVVSS